MRIKTIVVDDDTKRYLKWIKKFYEEKYGKTTWKQFMRLMTKTLQKELYLDGEELNLDGYAFLNKMFKIQCGVLK